MDPCLTCVKLAAPNRPQTGERGPVGSHFKTIPVRDGNGDQLLVYEFRDSRLLLGLLSKARRLELCTGEAVEMVDRNGFVVLATGERLTRV